MRKEKETQGNVNINSSYELKEVVNLIMNDTADLVLLDGERVEVDLLQ